MIDDGKNTHAVSGRQRLRRLRSELEESLAAMLRACPALAGMLDENSARTAAGSVLDGHGLPAEMEAALGEAPAGTLVSFDADRIQSWVFDSERIQVVAGASRKLQDLNAKADELTQLDDIHGVVFSAGGGGMLLASALDGAEERRRLAGEVEARLAQRAPELSFTVVAEPLLARDLTGGDPHAQGPPRPPKPEVLGRLAVAEGVQGALVRMQVRVREAKDARPPWRRPQLAERPGEVAERCPSCQRRPPSPAGEDVPADDVKRWCDWCRRMQKRGREDFEEGQDPWKRNGKVLTFEDLAGAAKAPRPYLAYFAADGNGMGRLAQSLQTFLQLRAFSVAVSEIYVKARETVVEVLADGYLEDDWQPEHAHLSLLSGGDEITLVLPAAPAPRVALAVQRAIEEGFRQATEPEGLLHAALGEGHWVLEELRTAGSGAGLLMAPAKYPIRWLRRYAGELQQQAKRLAAERGESSALAWRLLTDGSPLPRGAQGGAEGSLDDIDKRLREVKAAVEHRLPSSLLFNLLAQQQREETSVARALGKEEQLPVVAALTANFFRYQMARHSSLAAWWREVEAQEVEAQEVKARAGDLEAWLAQSHGRALEEILDLLSIAPFPSSAPTPAQEVP